LRKASEAGYLEGACNPRPKETMHMVEDLARTLHLSPTIFYLLFFATLVIGSLALGFALNRVIHHWTKKMANSWGELVLSLLESLPVPLLLLASIYGGLELMKLPLWAERVCARLLFVLTVVVVFYFPAKVLGIFLRRVGQRNPGMERVTNPASMVVRVLFVILAVTIILEHYHISLTGIWTTLGVGSVAVALALQETLSNLFAGLYLLADRPVNLGDYIRLDSGQEGYALHIGWRSTTIRTLAGNIVFVPNSTMAKAVITNYSLPAPMISVGIPVRVSYGSDPARVEKALLDVTREASRDGLAGLLLDPPPSVSLSPGFGESSLDFSLYVNVRQFEDQFSVQSELRKRILARFAQDGIRMPYPTRTLGLDEASLATLRSAEGAPGQPTP
jgi:small-conductance mechanosensitive channel